jgi:hypothetical protein
MSIITNSCVISASTILGPVQSSGLYTFSTFTFTNASATGRNGPTLSACQSAYSSASWAQNTNFFNMTTQGIQLWTVPESGIYEITAAGAAGGNNTQPSPNIIGGYGAVLTNRVSLVQGDIIAIVVGQMGTNRGVGPTGNYCGAGAGGGSFVYNSASLSYYTVAGGGGGAASTLTGLLTTQETAHGKYDTTSGTTVTIRGGFSAAGGTGGNGGSISTRNILFGGPGAGINTSGANANNLQGLTRTANWLGGLATTFSTFAVAGGFGGGGGGGAGEGNSSYQSYNWAGGGGGYSGGGCGGNGGQSDGQYGGGGGSNYTGTFISGTSGTNTGHGYVTITKI